MPERSRDAVPRGRSTRIGDAVHACHFCFARPTHEYLDFNAGRDFDKEIVVKVNVPEVLRVELARPSWKREHVALGTNTDPYQWVEGRYKLMRGIWEAMRDFANPCSILTKSPLLLRDKDLLLQIAERTTVSACLSVPTLDEKAWRATEPHTPHPRARLEAVAELNRIGIPTGILIAPLMPGINDGPGQVERIVELADGGGRDVDRRPGAVPARLHEGRVLRLAAGEAARPRRAYEQLYRRGALPAGEREPGARRAAAGAQAARAAPWSCGSTGRRRRSRRRTRPSRPGRRRCSERRDGPRDGLVCAFGHSAPSGMKPWHRAVLA